jgi:hypothetical protein
VAKLPDGPKNLKFPAVIINFSSKPCAELIAHDNHKMKKYFAPLDIVGAPPKNAKFATVKEAENVWNDKLYKVLRETYHYDEFRGKQKEVILNTLAGLFL